MKHLNGNTLCAVAIRTTGITPRHHDLVEITIAPIDWGLELDKAKLPYSLYIQPTRLENIDFAETKAFKLPDNNLDYKTMSIGKEDLRRYVTTGTEETLAADLLVKWCDQNIPNFPRKRIMPLAYDWAYCRQFIEDWLGKLTFDLVFDPRVRDIHANALFLNDRAGYRYDVQYPFAKTNLAYIMNRMSCQQDMSSTIGDAIGMIDSYRNMCKHFF